MISLRTRLMVRIQRVNVPIGLDIALANASQFNTPLIYSTSQSFMTKDLKKTESWCRNQMEESIHMWNTSTDHAERNYWQGYSTAMKWLLHKLQTDFPNDDTID